MGARREGRLRTTLGVFGTAFRNRSLVQVEVACLVFNGAEWGVWLALMVWSYIIGGDAAASLIVIGQLVMGGTMAGVAVAIAAGAPAEAD
jgi:hypothetical protein